MPRGCFQRCSQMPCYNAILYQNSAQSGRRCDFPVNCPGELALVDIGTGIRQSTKRLRFLLVPVMIIGLGYTVSFVGSLWGAEKKWRCDCLICAIGSMISSSGRSCVVLNRICDTLLLLSFAVVFGLLLSILTFIP